MTDPNSAESTADKRYAVVTGASSARQLAAYLPENYKVVTDERDLIYDENRGYVIEGEDVAGWTLDGYVIPRLASDLIWAKEQYVWQEETGGPESGPFVSTWLDDEPQTAEAVARRRREQEVEQGLVCPECGAHPDEGYEVTAVATRMQGGGWDTIYNCKRCGFKDIAT